jgi:hypothetical protein
MYATSWYSQQSNSLCCALLCSRDPAEIVPGLFVGSLDSARSHARLAKHGIQSIVDASQTDYRLQMGMDRLAIDVEDQSYADLKSHFNGVATFIRQSLNQGTYV